MIICGDSLEVLKGFPDNYVDTVITDPPYALTSGGKSKVFYMENEPPKQKGGGFMGMKWDSALPPVELFAELLRVCKPGAIFLCFGGTRTFHRLACNIEDAGWEIRDTLCWLYGSGFPKSLDISKAIDKANNVERKVVGMKPIAYPDSDCWGIPNKNTNGECFNPSSYSRNGNIENGCRPITAPATPAAKQWDGWGTALKPAYEPIIMAMKPLCGTFASNALEHGVAGLNIDGARIEWNQETPYINQPNKAQGWCIGKPHDGFTSSGNKKGRWPANVLLDEEAAKQLDQMSGELTSGYMQANQKRNNSAGFSGSMPQHTLNETFGDTGGASRFFYTAKASRRERDVGLDDAPRKYLATMGDGIGEREHNPNEKSAWVGNNHPTVKPVDLLTYLCKLTKTPTGGIVLDPFAGSGSTGIACQNTNRKFIGIERELEYCRIASRRLDPLARMAI